MSSTIQTMPASSYDPERIRAECAAIFRELPVLGDEAEGNPLSDHDLLIRPFESFELDSLSVMQYIMAIEDRFDVALDEVAVKQCQTIAELAELVRRHCRD